MTINAIALILVRVMKFHKINPENKKLIEDVMKISGQNVYACYQCGRCSATCPMVDVMELLPNQIFKFLQDGIGDEIYNYNTIEVCASCFSCAARCPQGLDLAAVNESLRVIKMRKNVQLFDINTLTVDELEDMPVIALISNFRKMTI